MNCTMNGNILVYFQALQDVSALQLSYVISEQIDMIF